MKEKTRNTCEFENTSEHYGQKNTIVKENVHVWGWLRLEVETWCIVKANLTHTLATQFPPMDRKTQKIRAIRNVNTHTCIHRFDSIGLAVENPPLNVLCCLVLCTWKTNIQRRFSDSHFVLSAKIERFRNLVCSVFYMAKDSVFCFQLVAAT